MSVYEELRAGVDRAEHEHAFVVATFEAEVADLRRPVVGWNAEDVRFDARRLYYRIDELGAAVNDARFLHDAGVRPIVSVKSRTAAGRWVPYEDVVARGFEILSELPPCDFSFNHEPEATRELAGTVDFRDAFDHVVSFLPLHARPVVCLMAFSFDTSAVEALIPRTARAVAVDGYNWAFTKTRPNAPWSSPEAVFEQAAIRVKGWGFPLEVWETGCQEDPSAPERRLQWLQELWGFAGDELETLSFYEGGQNAWHLFTGNHDDKVAQLLRLDEVI